MLQFDFSASSRKNKAGSEIWPNIMQMSVIMDWGVSECHMYKCFFKLNSFFLNFLKTHMPELSYVFMCIHYDEVGNVQ